MSDTKESLDQWEQARERLKKELLSCQEKHGLQSCYACEKLLECELRSRYVHAVYDSMNKGTGGGFEF